MKTPYCSADGCRELSVFEKPASIHLQSGGSQADLDHFGPMRCSARPTFTHQPSPPSHRDSICGVQTEQQVRAGRLTSFTSPQPMRAERQPLAPVLSAESDV